MKSKGAVLVLADGRSFVGKSLGAIGTTEGEVVFTTGMAGYQETLTDPSFAGQIITFTYSHIGNYGINEWDGESEVSSVESSGSHFNKGTRGRRLLNAARRNQRVR